MKALVTQTDKEREEALRVARVKAEHSSMRRVEQLPGVVEVRTGLEFREVLEHDPATGDQEEAKRGRLTAEAELADGRLVRAEAFEAAGLEKLLFGRVQASLAERPVATGQEHVPSKGK